MREHSCLDSVAFVPSAVIVLQAKCMNLMMLFLRETSSIYIKAIWQTGNAFQVLYILCGYRQQGRTYMLRPMLRRH